MLIDNLIQMHDSPLIPRLVLAKPSGEPLKVLSTPYNISRKVGLVETDELTFVIPTYVNESINIEKELCDGDFLIIFQLVTEVDEVFSEELFMITNPNIESGDENIKKIKCLSMEHLFSKKIINSFQGVKALYRTEAQIATWTSTPEYPTLRDYIESGILNYIMTLIQGWSIGTVDTSLLTLYRDMNVDEDTILGFLRGTVQSSFQCIFIFDTMNKTISAKKIDTVGQDNGLILSDQNYIDKINMDIKTDDIVTKLYLYGKDNMSISTVNPTGSEFLLNLDYYSREKFMSSELISRINDYEAKIEMGRDFFADLVQEREALTISLGEKENEIKAKEIELENVIKERDASIEFQLEISKYNNSKNYSRGQSVRYENSHGVLGFYTCIRNCVGISPDNTTYWISFLADINRFLGFVTSELNALKEEKNRISESLIRVDGEIANMKYNFIPYIDVSQIEEHNNTKTYKIKSLVKKENALYSARKDVPENIEISDTVYWREVTLNFTKEQIEERDFFIKEKVYRDENYTNPKDLYEKGLELSNLYAQPAIDISVDIVDFLNIVDYEADWLKLNLGDIVTLNHSIMESETRFTNIHLKMKIIGYQHDYENNNLTLSISNKSRFTDSYVQLEELLDKTSKASTSLDINKFQYADYIKSGQKDVISDYLNNKLDFAKHKAITNSNQTMYMDETGLILKNREDNSKQLKLMSDHIVMTDDNWQTAKTAISTSGVMAETIVGTLGAFCEVRTNQLIVGSNLIGDDLINSDKINNSIQQGSSYNGVVINSSNGLSVTQSGTNITTMVNATDGITIGRRNSENNGWNSKQFYVDLSGKIIASDMTITNGQLKAGTDVLLDMDTKTLDFSKFNVLLGKIGSDNLEVKGLSVTNSENVKTFGIDNNGNVTLSGNITWSSPLSYNDLTDKPNIGGSYGNSDVDAWLTGTRGLILQDGHLKIFADNIVGNTFQAMEWMAIGNQSTIGDKYLYFNKGSHYNRESYIKSSPHTGDSSSDLTLSSGGDLILNSTYRTQINGGAYGMAISTIGLDLSDVRSITWGNNAPQAVFK